MSENFLSRLGSLAWATIVTLACVGNTDGWQDDSGKQDFKDQLVRVAPTAAEAALGSFQVADGFQMQLVAAEPVVVDPVAMAFDEYSRMYVVEMRGYSENRSQGLGRIRLLEDKNADGFYETSSVFADGLHWPTAVACFDGGIFLGAAPHIFYLKDTDQDNRADLKKVVFTGFGTGNVQGLLNSFQWGLDNRIHGATSVNGAEVSSGSDQRSANSLILRGRDFAIEPRSLKITATSGGGQHGMSFNRWGDKFVSSNSDHIQQVLFEDRYVARNPYFAAGSTRRSIAVDGPQAEVFRTSPVEAWRTIRTRLRVKGLVPGPIEGGGRASGYFTGATGVTVYRGNRWPEESFDWAVVGDVGSNLIHRKRLDLNGSLYSAVRVDQKSELVSSNDIWFRPVQFCNGPDGSLYVADMYREFIEHPLSLPPSIKKHLDLNSGNDRGRIYRIAPVDFPRAKTNGIGHLASPDLVPLLDHANGWHRETAARLLYQRHDTSIVPAVAELIEAGTATGKIRGLYLLNSLGSLDDQLLRKSLLDTQPQVRRHAIRLAESRIADSPSLRELAGKITDDPDLQVVEQLAFSVGEFPPDERTAILARIVIQHASSPSIRTPVFSSLGDGSARLLSRLIEIGSFCDAPAASRWIKDLAKQVGKRNDREEIDLLLQTLDSTDNPRVFGSVLDGLEMRHGSPLLNDFLNHSEKFRDALKKIMNEAIKTASNPHADAKARLASVRRLRMAPFSDLKDWLPGLLATSNPSELRVAALETLTSFDDPQIAETLLENWKHYGMNIKHRVSETLCARPAWLQSVVSAIATGKIRPEELAPGRLDTLGRHSDQTIRKTVARIVAEHQAERLELIKTYRDVLVIEGDAARGKNVFAKHCQSCHRLQGQGYEIAPNLAAMANRGNDSILTNVIFPNQELNPQFESITIVTMSGQVFNGMIKSESANSITLIRADNDSNTILRNEIDEVRYSGQSLMPEGLEKVVDKQSMADVIEYIRTSQ